jgi:hypothetical protein
MGRRQRVCVADGLSSVSSAWSDEGGPRTQEARARVVPVFSSGFNCRRRRCKVGRQGGVAVSCAVVHNNRVGSSLCRPPCPHPHATASTTPPPQPPRAYTSSANSSARSAAGRGTCLATSSCRGLGSVGEGCPPLLPPLCSCVLQRAHRTRAWHLCMSVPTPACPPPPARRSLSLPGAGPLPHFPFGLPICSRLELCVY